VKGRCTTPQSSRAINGDGNQFGGRFDDMNNPLDWTNEDLGAKVRSCVERILSGDMNRACDANDATTMSATAMALICIAYQCNSAQSTVTHHGVTLSHMNIGDWEVVVRNIDK